MGLLLALRNDPPAPPGPGSSLWTVAQKGDAAGSIVLIDDTNIQILADSSSDQNSFDFAYQEIASGDIDVQALVPQNWVGHIENFTGFGVGITDGLDDTAFYAQCWRPSVGPMRSKWGTGPLNENRAEANGIAGTTLPRFARVTYDSVAQEISFWERSEGEPWALINTVAQALTYPLYAYVFGTSHLLGQSTTALMTQCVVSAGQQMDTTPPNHPPSVHTVVISSTRIDVTWGASEDLESGIQGYRVYRSLEQNPPGSGFNFQQVSPLVAGLSYSDTGLTPDTDYYYVVTAVNGVGLESEFSAPIRGPEHTPPDEDPPSGTAPLLFQDLSGRDFAGEPGALAVNDDWANTVYSYTRRFAPDVGTLDTPTGNPAKPGVSGVNPNNAAEYLAIDRAGFIEALENVTYTRVFVAKGTDVRGSEITMNAGSGTQAAPRKFYWWDPDAPTNITDIRPWDLDAADRVLLPRIVFNNVSWLWFVGFNVDGNAWVRCENGTNNCLWYRCEATNFPSHAFVGTTGGGARPHNLVALECYVHDSQIVAGSDVHAFLGNPCDHLRVISCAGRHCKGDFYQVDGNSEGGIVEDCDFWNDTFYDAAGNIDLNGDFAQAEGFVDIKNFGAGVEPMRIYGNRVWNLKPPVEGTGSASPMRFSNTNVRKRNIDVRWNVFTNCWDGGVIYSGASELNGSGEHSVVRNIIDTIHGSSQSQPLIYAAYDKSEYYLNTLSNSPNTTPRIVHFFSPNEVQDLDMMGQLMIDVPDAANAWGSTGNLNINTGKVGYNTYVGQYQTFSQGYEAANDNLFADAGGKTNFAAGDFTYVRKKLINPENATIPGIVPTTQSLAAMGTLVPTSGEDQIGSRAGIGIDDDF